MVDRLFVVCSDLIMLQWSLLIPFCFAFRIAIGKRNSGRNGRLASLAMLSHQAEANTYSDHNELLQDQPVPSSSSFEEPPVARESSAGRAIPRPNTSRSGDSQFVRLFPKSGDHERIVGPYKTDVHKSQQNTDLRTAWKPSGL